MSIPACIGPQWSPPAKQRDSALLDPDGANALAEAVQKDLLGDGRAGVIHHQATALAELQGADEHVAIGQEWNAPRIDDAVSHGFRAGDGRFGGAARVIGLMSEIAKAIAALSSEDPSPYLTRRGFM